jgi:threonine dehydrogenase-like Zn-dependent dehydrogenase
MGFAVALTAPRAVELIDEPDVPLGPADVRVQTQYSAISAGTKLTQFRGNSPYLSKRWDPRRRLFIEDSEPESTHFPLTTWGYEEVGEVIEVGHEGLSVGTVMYAPVATARIL